MSYTQKQLDDLRANIARGVFELEMANGERVKYRSLAEMRQIEAVIVAELGVGGASAYVNPVYSKGT